MASQFTSGTGKWFLCMVFSLYGFVLWAVIGGLAWGLGASPWILGSAIITLVIFYFVFILSWYKKKEEIYRVANLSHWCDNITFLNDKGTVSIRQDRITEIIDLNASVSDIVKITKKDPEFLRIKTALISDARKMKEEPGFDLEVEDDDTNVDEMLSNIKELDEKKLGYIASGDKDPIQFKYKYFRITNIIKPRMEWIPIVSRRQIETEDELPMPDGEVEKKIENDEEKKKKDDDRIIVKIDSLEKELVTVRNVISESQKDIEEFMNAGKIKDASKAKKKVVQLVGEETDLTDKINRMQMEIKNKGYLDLPKENLPEMKSPAEKQLTIKKEEEEEEESGEIIDDDEENEDDDEENSINPDKEKEPDDSIEVNDDDDDDEKEFSPSKDIADESRIIDFEDEDQQTMLDTYKKVDRLSSHRIIGRFLNFVDVLKKKGKESDAYDANIYRTFTTDGILKVLDKNALVTIEDLRNSDKIKIAQSIGFTADEMKEFVKYCEEETKQKTIRFWDDLIPKEMQTFNVIKLVHVQQKAPEKMVYLITYAEPIELIFPKKVIALPYNEVHVKPRLKDEQIPVDIRMFEQAVYELPDKIESCLKFVPGGNANLFDYPVIVPLTYATFVLKGWMGTNIPIFKAIATTYDVNRELDDYKHFLSHEHVLIKAMVGYVNHIKSNTNLSMQHIDATQQEIDNMKDELEDQRQLRLRQIYFRSGGMASPDVIDKMWGNNQQQPAAPEPKKHNYKQIVGSIIGVIFILILLYFVFKK